MNQRVVWVVGGGLAGCECALQLAERGVHVKLFEQRPISTTQAHHGAGLAELVCSNSFKSMRPDSAAGLLKEELNRMGSHLLECARIAAVPAGGALAVDRDRFCELVEEKIVANSYIELIRTEIKSLPDDPQQKCVIAAGPLCSESLSQTIQQVIGANKLSFYDAAAPIVDAETIDKEIAFTQSRYDVQGCGDYLNCPMDKDEYQCFMDALLQADRVIDKAFEQKDLFCACQPIEEVARTGMDAVRFGAMKPVGLVDPRTGKRPWAVVQLRPENDSLTAYNMVGFQTNLTWPEQRRVFTLIPGLKQAEFFRYGVMHRNSFIDSPHCLDPTFKAPGTEIRFAGQICGTEGYTEAIASGLLAALNTYAELIATMPVQLPVTGALGSLVAYATNPSCVDYQPMHVNFGIVPPLEGQRMNKRQRYKAYVKRALDDLNEFIRQRGDLFVK